MSDPLARLRALVEASFAPVPAGEAPEGVLRRLEDELDACLAALLAGGEPVPFDELRALADAFRDRSRTLDAETSRAHFDWLRIQRGWYKPVLGPDGKLRRPELPAGVVSPPLALVPRVYHGISGLRYELHRRRHPAPCDCAALVAAGIGREPRSPDLRPTGRTSDGYYVGDGFLCGSCGARWFRGISDDDVGSTFWELASDD